MAEPQQQSSSTFRIQEDESAHIHPSQPSCCSLHSSRRIPPHQLQDFPSDSSRGSTWARSTSRPAIATTCNLSCTTASNPVCMPPSDHLDVGNTRKKAPVYISVETRFARLEHDPSYIPPDSRRAGAAFCWLIADVCCRRRVSETRGIFAPLAWHVSSLFGSNLARSHARISEDAELRLVHITHTVSCARSQQRCGTSIGPENISRIASPDEVQPAAEA